MVQPVVKKNLDAVISATNLKLEPLGFVRSGLTLRIMAGAAFK
jgi:hypothetical protein